MIVFGFQQVARGSTFVPFPLTPTLSLRERENLCQFFRSLDVPPHLRPADAPPAILPLPVGA